MSSNNSFHTINPFSRFFQEDQGRFLSFAYSYTRNKAVAEGALMEAMISLWENHKKWEKDSNLHTLLLIIIRDKSLNYLEHKQVHVRAKEAINVHKQRELDLRVTTLEAYEPGSIFNTGIQRIVYKALEQLSEQSRHIFILSRYHNAPNKKIAEQLDISIKGVEFHITKALRLLQLGLKDCLVSLLF